MLEELIAIYPKRSQQPCCSMQPITVDKIEIGCPLK
jgi:hypothetical protein